MQQETSLRKCKAVLDLSSVYEKMVQLCSKEDSRPPLAPAFIVKYLLVSFLYSKPSNRQIVAGADADILLIKDDLTLDTVIAGGRKMMEGGTLLVRGTYEHD